MQTNITAKGGPHLRAVFGQMPINQLTAVARARVHASVYDDDNPKNRRVQKRNTSPIHLNELATSVASTRCGLDHRVPVQSSQLELEKCSCVWLSHSVHAFSVTLTSLCLPINRVDVIILTA